MGTPRDSRDRQAEAVIERLREEHPDATISLDFSSRLELLVAVILSAQCTDERVNRVTDDLFDEYRTAADYAEADVDDLAAAIGSVTYPNQKAGWIADACRTIVAEHGGEVPDTMDELTDLSGVGRKTANVVLQHGHGVVEGIVVDTHVQRLSRRLGLTEAESPEAIERDLIGVVPAGEWRAFTHLLIAHGRATCTARNPDCGDCALADLCPSERGDGAIDLAADEPWE
ncbi:MAG: endonuclease III [Haloferacaceae archaeon]